MEETNALNQIVDKVKDSNNILVTVNTIPSVDELSAALGITLLLNKLDKHATAVFSGDVPP
jgi:nanoRNase/pAp phosphatase (c-di-AMP/oligoRNAs hydrolase)